MNEPNHVAGIVQRLKTQIRDPAFGGLGEQTLKLLVPDRCLKDPKDTRINPFPYEGKIAPLKINYLHLSSPADGTLVLSGRL